MAVLYLPLTTNWGSLFEDSASPREISIWMVPIRNQNFLNSGMPSKLPISKWYCGILLAKQSNLRKKAMYLGMALVVHKCLVSFNWFNLVLFPTLLLTTSVRFRFHLRHQSWKLVLVASGPCRPGSICATVPGLWWLKMKPSMCVHTGCLSCSTGRDCFKFFRGLGLTDGRCDPNTTTFWRPSNKSAEPSWTFAASHAGKMNPTLDMWRRLLFTVTVGMPSSELFNVWWSICPEGLKTLGIIPKKSNNLVARKWQHQLGWLTVCRCERGPRHKSWSHRRARCGVGPQGGQQSWGSTLWPSFGLPQYFF